MRFIHHVAHLFVCLSFAIGFVACGDDSNGGPGGGGGDQSPEESAASAAENSASLAVLQSDPENEQALTDITTLSQQLKGLAQFGVVTPTDGSDAVSLAVNKAVRQQPQLGDCVTSSGNTVTYTLCEVSAFRVSGEVVTEGDTMDVNLTLDANEDELNTLLTDYALALGGDLSDVTIVDYTADFRATGLTVTDTLIDGTVELSDEIVTEIATGTGETTRVPTETTVSATYSNVQYDADNCAVGGQLTMDLTSGGTQFLDNRPVTASYGPTCGDVTVTEEEAGQ